eukprot:SAG31_NODE_9404_length_1282_cov_12.380389_2_plen_163_part_00
MKGAFVVPSIASTTLSNAATHLSFPAEAPPSEGIFPHPNPEEEFTCAARRLHSSREQLPVLWENHMYRVPEAVQKGVLAAIRGMPEMGGCPPNRHSCPQIPSLVPLRPPRSVGVGGGRQGGMGQLAKAPSNNVTTLYYRNLVLLPGTGPWILGGLLYPTDTG